MSGGDAGPDVTQDHLLDGRVRHDQPRRGHRTGIEPVLLAASIPVRPGERIVEAGTGSGATLLCVAARVPGIVGVGIERDAAAAAIAWRNAASNSAPLTIVTEDIASWQPDGPFNHACANPPWHDPVGTPSPDAGQEAARRGAPGLLSVWVARLAAALRYKGTLTLVVATAAVPECLAAFAAAGCGGAVLFPLWPMAGRDAKLSLLRGVRGGRAAFRVAPGLVLHMPDGDYTPAANDVLRHGAALTL